MEDDSERAFVFVLGGVCMYVCIMRDPNGIWELEPGC